jgi:hypothetical protein
MAGIRCNAVPDAGTSRKERVPLILVVAANFRRTNFAALEYFLKYRNRHTCFIAPVNSANQSLAKQRRSLSPTAAPGRAPSRTRSCPLIQTRSCPLIHIRPLEPLLSRLLWLYSRAVQTEVLADNSL